jgi:hypothetical protein
LLLLFLRLLLCRLFLLVRLCRARDQCLVGTLRHPLQDVLSLDEAEAVLDSW